MRLSRRLCARQSTPALFTVNLFEPLPPGVRSGYPSSRGFFAFLCTHFFIRRFTSFCINFLSISTRNFLAFHSTVFLNLKLTNFAVLFKTFFHSPYQTESLPIQGTLYNLALFLRLFKEYPFTLIFQNEDLLLTSTETRRLKPFESGTCKGKALMRSHDHSG